MVLGDTRPFRYMAQIYSHDSGWSVSFVKTKAQVFNVLPQWVRSLTPTSFFGWEVVDYTDAYTCLVFSGPVVSLIGAAKI